MFSSTSARSAVIESAASRSHVPTLSTLRDPVICCDRRGRCRTPVEHIEDPEISIRAVAIVARCYANKYQTGDDLRAVAMLWAMSSSSRSAYVANGFNLSSSSGKLLHEREQFQIPSSYRLAVLAGL